MPSRKLPVFDVRVCEGRLCVAHGADDLKARAQAFLDDHPQAGRVRLNRGGCYGLCDLAANVVVNRYASTTGLPPEDQDRLSLTERKHETAYAAVEGEEMVQILRSHLEADDILKDLTGAVRGPQRPPESTVAARMRELREKRARR